MFPTSGYFRSHNCPYYLSGLCERPYCHFRHVKQEERPHAVPLVHSVPKNQPRRISESSSAGEPAASAAPAPSRRQASESESSDTGAGDYTPTPLSVLRRTKDRPPEAAATAAPARAEFPTYEPTPVPPQPRSQEKPSTGSSSRRSSPPPPVARRRPLQLPAPKIGGCGGGGSSSSALSGVSASATGADDDDFYDPVEDTDTAGPSKRSRCLASPPPEAAAAVAAASYEPTPIDSGNYGGGGSDGDDGSDGDEYCPTSATTTAPTSAASVPPLAKDAFATSTGSQEGTGIKQVFLDLFGEEPTAPSRPAKQAAAASAVVAPTPRAPVAVAASNVPRGSRPSPAEQVARRAQLAAANPSGLLSQGKVRVAVSSTPAVASVTPLAGSVANKIPEVVRQRYLDRLSEECRQVGATPDRAAKRAQQLELECHERSANRNVYLNAVILAIKRVRTSADESQQSPRKQAPENASQLSDKRLHKQLMQYALTEAQLAENKFPPHRPALPYTQPVNPLERLCVRCGTVFLLQQPQLSVPPGQCCYHYGRAYSRRMPGTGVQQIYSCCGGDLQAKGCSLAARHVHEYNAYCDTAVFKQTVEPDKETVRKKQRLAVYALDCEMVYTDAGKELARVTIIDRNLAVVYDRIVKPSAPIVDCNTRFSGLKEEQLNLAEHRLADVQHELLQMVHSTCILIGHSLESDLHVLKLRHHAVVDTSIVFPHRQGLPKKRALRNLASEILNKIIQAGGDAGHDSSEDARACMELMLNKVTEDLKKGKSPG